MSQTSLSPAATLSAHPECRLPRSEKSNKETQKSQTVSRANLNEVLELGAHTVVLLRNGEHEADVAHCKFFSRQARLYHLDLHFGARYSQRRRQLRVRRLAPKPLLQPASTTINRRSRKMEDLGFLLLTWTFVRREKCQFLSSSRGRRLGSD